MIVASLKSLKKQARIFAQSSSTILNHPKVFSGVDRTVSVSLD
jgi:hypothetical protein